MQLALPRFRGNFKPNGTPRLAYGASGGLDNFVFGDGGPPLNLTGPNAATLVSGPRYRSTLVGYGGYGTGGGYFHIPTQSIGLSASVGWSLRVVGLPISWPANFSALLDCVGRSPAALFADTTGTYDFGNVLSATPPSFQLPAGKLFDFVVTGLGGSPFTVTWYLNGASFGTSASWTTTTTTPQSLDLGANTSAGGVNPDMVYFRLQTWQRAISAAEVAALYADIWGDVIFPEDDTSAILVGVASAFTAKSRRSLSARVGTRMAA